MAIPKRDCKSAVSLERRLAAYAMAGGAMLVTAEASNAAVVYSGVQDISIRVDQTVNLDLNGDAVNDFFVYKL